MRIPSGVTDQVIYFVGVDSTDFTTRETGLSSFTVYRSRNGGSATAMTTPSVTELDSTNMPGVYALLLDEDMTIGSGNDSEELAFHITHTGMAPVTRTIELYRPKITAGETLTVSSGIPSGLLLTTGTAQAGADSSITLASGEPATDSYYNAAMVYIASGTGAGQARLCDFYSGSTKVLSVLPDWETNPDSTSVYAILPFNAVTLQALNSGNSVDDSAGTSLYTWVSNIVNGRSDVNVVRWNGGTVNSPTSGNIHTNVVAISGDSTAADNAESFFDGAGYKDADNFFAIRSGTAQAGAAGSITLDSGASASDDFYNNTYIQIVSGTGVGQARFIDDYTGSTKVASVSANWVTNPDNTSVFIVWPFAGIPGASAPTAADVADAVWDEDLSGHTTASTAGKAVSDILTDTGTTLDGKLDTIDGNVDAILVDTGTTLPGTLSTLDGKLDTIDSNVDAVLVDTGTTLDGKLDTIDSNVDAILVDTGTTLPGTLSTIDGKLDTVDSNVDAILVDTGTTLDGKLDTIDSNVDAILVDTGTTLPASLDALPTASENADAVWDEASSGHTTAGTYGKAVSDILADTNELQTDDIPTKIASLDSKIDTIDGNVDSVLEDTGTTIPATLSTIDDFLDTEVAAILEDTGTTIPGLLATIDSNVDSILEDTGTTIPGLIAALNDISASDVNAQVLDVLNTDTFAEPSSVPAAAATLAAKIGWLYLLARNKIDQTASAQTVYADDGTTEVAEASVSDDATTATRGEWSSD